MQANTPILGKGTFGTVYKAVLRGQGVAVKKFFTQSLDESLLEDFKNEVMIMSALSHPNVLLFMGACFEPGNLIIVTGAHPRVTLTYYTTHHTACHARHTTVR